MIPWTVARLAPLSMEFPKQRYWSGLPFLSPGDLPDPGIKSASPTVADFFFFFFFNHGATWEPQDVPHLSIYSSTDDGHLDYFHLLALRNHAAADIHCKFCVAVCLHFFYLGVLLGPMANLCLIF